MRPRMVETCRRIADSPRFQAFIFGVIVLNAITLGLGTYDFSPEAESALNVLDEVFLGIFVVELAIRITAFGRRPQDFFKEGWNVFDFVVIALAFLPGLRDNITLLRLARLLRVVRLVSVMPDLRILLRAMARSLPPIRSLVLLTVLLMYIYGMVGWICSTSRIRSSGATSANRCSACSRSSRSRTGPSTSSAARRSTRRRGSSSSLRPARLVPGDQRPAGDHHQLDGGGPRGRARGAPAPREEIASADGTVAQRLEEIRAALDRLEAQLAEGGGDLPGPARSIKRPTKGGRMR